MTPAARVALAVELLERIEAGGVADRETANFFRSRRFAGSKDRAAVSHQVYAVLRRRAELMWRLRGANLPVDARRLVLAELASTGDQDPAGVRALFDGSRFGPAALDASEQAAIPALQAPMSGTPDWVQGAYPEWLDAALRERFGGDVIAEMHALTARAPVDLRVNRLKGTRDDALEALAMSHIDATATPLSPVGVRLAGRAELAKQSVFTGGLVEPQDEGSQIVALLVAAKPKMQVVDLCAGAGGKTLALAAEMQNRGQIYACDIEERRLRRVEPRLQRAGVRNVQTHVLRDGDDPLLTELVGKADRVLIDAPCSGIGTWRRQPDARWRLTPDDLTRDRHAQAALLDRAAPLLRPGGQLVYATCSLLPSENEDQVQRFLSRQPSFVLRPASEVWRETLQTEPPGDSPYLRLTPLRHGTDGFFAAVLRQSG
ncbi:MAG TPA: RsmB/NOP family class I SAM-dependent RNA methyltransferase [Candidatus Cybelea sp.]|nr:RsmB/NOP family class I SAM-dependent RNA methyltransferase [Candidatus Cybelea sp.]